ncbi:MAG: OPT family oligopeptide transporter [Polyangiales bacterium]
MAEALQPNYREQKLTPPDDPEHRWLREVYQGEAVPQLTPRAVIAGMILGAFLVGSNLITALRTGWSFGVTITAGIMAYVIFGLLERVGLIKRHFGMLENNAMQSVASAAGYMTGGGTAAAIPALMMATEQPIAGHVMFLWITTIAVMGVFMAIPMKRQMINQEGLRFPSGIAAAETLRQLHPEDAAALDARKTLREGEVAEAKGEVTDPRAAGRALFRAGGVTAVYTYLREHHLSWLFNIPESFKPPLQFHGHPLAKWSVAFDTSLLLFAAGGIMGWRSAWSMMVGSCINYFALAPHGFALGGITEVKYSAIAKWTVWFGSSLLLTAGLLSFAFTWRQVARAFGDVGKIFSRKTGEVEDPLAKVEVPMSWFVAGMLTLTPIVAFLAWVFFGIAWWMSLLCVAMSFFIAIVASRATGETDTTPTGALGKITQLTFGVLAPGSVSTNLMTASMSAGVAIHAADLLTDLKSGYLLGARPRQQFFAQFFGVLAGGSVVVFAFQKLVPNHTVIGTERLPAPGAISWLAVARGLTTGLAGLPRGATTLIAVGAAVGVVLVLADKFLPKYRRYIPSATGFGMAFTMPFANTLSMFLGALLALAWEKRDKRGAETFIVPISSGVIAAEGLVAIAMALYRAL